MLQTATGAVGGTAANQRAEVLSLAKKGLIPDSEREVLLHQVLADSHEIARHALDRRVEEHRRLALGGRGSAARELDKTTPAREADGLHLPIPIDRGYQIRLGHVSTGGS